MPTIPLNANGAARRKVVAQVRAEESLCALCGKPVDKSLTFAWGQHGKRCTDPACPGCVPHPMRGEVDEIIPRAHGGSPYQRSNCQLTHRMCNQRKGGGTGHPPRERVSFQTSTAW